MDIQPTSFATPSSTQEPAVRGTRDEFLKLFLAQLQHQDPLDPKDGADMVAQLAQFSAVEQAVRTNEQLTQLAALQTSASAAGLSDLVDRTCTASATTFTVDGTGGSPPPLELSASDPIRGATVIIRDAEGKELRRIAVPDGGATTSVAWDGRDAQGNPLRAGTYQIEVTSASGASITANWRGRVDAIELTADGPRLRMGGLLVAPADVHTIGTTQDGAQP